MLTDRGYDHDRYRRVVWDLGVKPQIARRGTEHGPGLGTQRWVVERAFAHLHWFRRQRIRREIRDDIHEAFLSVARSIICRRRLKKLRPRQLSSSRAAMKPRSWTTGKTRCVVAIQVSMSAWDDLMALINASITSSFGLPTFRLSSSIDTSWYDMTSCHQNRMRKRHSCGSRSSARRS